MAAAMRHRGPDGEGFLVRDPRAPGLALAMRRLSIIDIAGGQQPIWNETLDVGVVFNGELYNYRELRQRLIRCGHEFTTQSDTEILVHAWEEWGEECLSELRGMFAFALADFRKQYNAGPVLFLARDPLGIKPLYYTQTEQGFAFASEVRALMASGIPSREISQDALTSYLLFGSVSEPVTMFEGVFRSRPDIVCCCTFRTGGGCRAHIRGGTPGGVRRRRIRGRRKASTGQLRRCGQCWKTACAFT